jgi:hypothetical protein
VRHQSAVPLALLFLLAAEGKPDTATMFFDDFDGIANVHPGVAAEWSGVTTLQSVGTYQGVGWINSSLSGNFLRNSTGDYGTQGIAGDKTTLTLGNLPSHSRVNLGFLAVLLNSWDAPDSAVGPDWFNVSVDGRTIFSGNPYPAPEYVWSFHQPPFPDDRELFYLNPNVYGTESGEWGSFVWNLGLNSAFQNIPHTSSTLTIDWFANGAGWQGGADESWAIDNVSVALNSAAVPEPASAVVWTCAGLMFLFAGMWRRWRSWLNGRADARETQAVCH